MIGVTSLDLVAFPLRHSNRRIVCALDAGRGEIYHASYRQSPGGVQRISEPMVASPDDLASDLAAIGGEMLLAGDGVLRYRVGVRLAAAGGGRRRRGGLPARRLARAARPRPGAPRGVGEPLPS